MKNALTALRHLLYQCTVSHGAHNDADTKSTEFVIGDAGLDIQRRDLVSLESKPTA
jgi:hypothetical protein